MVHDIWSYIQQLFRNQERVKAEPPFLHENINLDSFPYSDYHIWLKGNIHQLLKSRLQQAYFSFITSGDPLDAAFEFYDTPQSNGFAIFQRKNYTLSDWDFRFFQHYIADVLQKENYVINLTDVRSQSKSSWIEKVFRYYLKPSYRLRSLTPSEQLYGNISIEYIKRNDHPYMFRLLANVYQDQNFGEVQSFGDLMKKISG